ncbi:hypothetical protein Sjap_002979 [Stephania japonica]|uniref:Uncharacterized protein n=1 Tax=Stephania japonica TaxID=461633 RepID=A0AAP0PV11_9MAGN
MKSGGVSSYALPAKRGGRSLALAVLGLVILSMLVPLMLLLSLHNGLHSTNGFIFKDSGIVWELQLRGPKSCSGSIGGCSF